MSLPLPYRPKAVTDLIEEEKRTSLKIVLKKKAIFLDIMVNWYENLSKKEKSVLTKKNLHRRGVAEAFRLGLAYTSIPMDWTSTMVKRCGLVCYISKSALKRRQLREAAAAAAELAAESEEVTPQEPVEDVSVNENGSKKLVDLTSQEPPQEWKAAKDAGNALPRYLTIGSTESANIMYWDYDVSHWKVDGDVKSTRNPGRVTSGPDAGILFNEWDN